MRVRFIATAALVEYHSLDEGRTVALHNGEEAELSAEKAGQILADFPDNFAVVLDEAAEAKAFNEPPAHRMVTTPPEVKAPVKWRRR